MTEDEMVVWHHRHEFEQALGDGEGQGSLACCSPWGHKELDTTELLKNNNGPVASPLHASETSVVIQDITFPPSFFFSSSLKSVKMCKSTEKKVF